MAADSYDPVSLRNKSKKRSRGDGVTMSRRRISCKELGQVDCQGWLYRKRETKGFIGIKWKKYWFVLKRTSLYWYSSHTAEKAEGFINLTDFTVDQATECRKKHAIKARHPQIRTFYFAAESPEEMNKWLKKLKKGLASIRCEPPAEVSQDCWSESDHEESHLTADTPPPPYSMDSAVKPEETLPPPYSSTPPGAAPGLNASPSSTLTSQGSDASVSKAVCEDRQSWLDISNSSQASSAGQSLTCSLQIHSKHPQPDSSDPAGDSSLNPISRSRDSLHEELLNPTSCADPEKEVSLPGSVESVPESASSDEMEKLYKSLEQASLSPIGERKPSTRKEFRKSFIKRCKNQAVNDKLHQIRTLNSTLKAREDDLMTIAQVLEKPSLTAQEYREWKEINLLLLQEICQNYQPHTEGEPKAPNTQPQTCLEGEPKAPDTQPQTCPEGEPKAPDTQPQTCPEGEPKAPDTQPQTCPEGEPKAPDTSHYIETNV